MLNAGVTTPACAGQTIPATITTKFDRAAGLIESAQSTTGKKQRRLFRKAKSNLSRALKAVRNAAKGKKSKLSADCADALERAANGVRSGLGS
jgi:hypothetical protein